MIVGTTGDVRRFISHVDFLPCGCWYWTGSRSRGGGNRKWYPTFYVSPRGDRPGYRVRAHRYSCEVLGGLGPLPPGHHRDHTCNFSMCVRPHHLEYVTREVNQARKLERVAHVPRNITQLGILDRMVGLLS